MSACGRIWCENELRIYGNNDVTVRHRGTISRFTVGATYVVVTATVLGDYEPTIEIETAELGDASTTSLATLRASDAWTFLYGMTETMEEIITDAAQERGETPDFGATLRKSAEKEREEYGPYLRMGPFDDSPYGLADQVTDHFTASEGATERAASWLLGMMASRHVEAGEIDRRVARELADDLGPDAAQVVGGWVFRAA